VHCPDTDTCRDGGNDKPVTPPNFDASRRTGKDHEQANISENADESCNQDQAKVMLVDDAF
jgi:hypothetical protein